jgi:hypothetical protein
MCRTGGDFGDARPVDAIRRVINSPNHEVAFAVCRKKQIPFDEKKLE